MTHSSMKGLVIASIVSNSNTHVNGSLCQIISLEVYRGKTLTTEISHVGFALRNNGIFGVRNLYEQFESLYTDTACSDKSKPTCLQF